LRRWGRSEPSHLILLDSLDKITMFIEQELAKQKGEAVETFDDLQIDLYIHAGWTRTI
jgi:hypothetical protein